MLADYYDQLDILTNTHCKTTISINNTENYADLDVIFELAYVSVTTEVRVQS